MTGPPRNPRQWEDGERNRAAILAVLDAHSLRLPPLRLKQIKYRLFRDHGIVLSISTIWHHLQLIWEREAIELQKDSDLSPNKDAA